MKNKSNSKNILKGIKFDVLYWEQEDSFDAVLSAIDMGKKFKQSIVIDLEEYNVGGAEDAGLILFSDKRFTKAQIQAALDAHGFNGYDDEDEGEE